VKLLLAILEIWGSKPRHFSILFKPQWLLGHWLLPASYEYFCEWYDIPSTVAVYLSVQTPRPGSIRSATLDRAHLSEVDQQISPDSWFQDIWFAAFLRYIWSRKCVHSGSPQKTTLRQNSRKYKLFINTKHYFKRYVYFLFKLVYFSKALERTYFFIFFNAYPKTSRFHCAAPSLNHIYLFYWQVDSYGRRDNAIKASPICSSIFS